MDDNEETISLKWINESTGAILAFTKAYIKFACDVLQETAAIDDQEPRRLANISYELSITETGATNKVKIEARNWQGDSFIDTAVRLTYKMPEEHKIGTSPARFELEILTADDVIALWSYSIPQIPGMGQMDPELQQDLLLEALNGTQVRAFAKGNSNYPSFMPLRAFLGDVFHGKQVPGIERRYESDGSTPIAIRAGNLGSNLDGLGRT